MQGGPFENAPEAPKTVFSFFWFPSIPKSGAVPHARANLPVNGWDGGTAKARRKTRWEVLAPNSPMLAFAAIRDVWKSPSGTEIASLATVTVDPSADVAPIHHRMAAILEPDDRPVWLGEAEGDPEVRLRPFPDKRLTVNEANAALRRLVPRRAPA